MYKFLKEAHSGLAYLVILSLLISTLFYLVLFFTKKKMKKSLKTPALITMIIVHLQVLFGIIVYFISPIIQSGLSDFGGSMKNSLTRLQILEHPLMMIIAAVLVTIAHRQVKSKSLAGNQLNIGAPILFLIAFAIVLSRIPWSVWTGA